MSDKILKLSQAQTLYQDLRERIDALPTDSDIPEVPVQDVQVNGTSILSQGAANVPIASNDNLGVVKTFRSYGVQVGNNGALIIEPAGDSNIKIAQGLYLPITSAIAYKATFYGLAKAAGDSTQSVSTNAVGLYTNEAKAAIRSMLGAAASADLTVQDVQMNGTSILNNGIANIPIASANALGAIKVNSAYGLVLIQATDANNNLYYTGEVGINVASNGEIKASSGDSKPISASKQHRSVFYGLAKAAGDSTQSVSTNAVGLYTDEAKSAIQNMLGVPSTNDLNIYATKADTVLTTTLSRGRKANTTIGEQSLAFGYNVEAVGKGSHAEGSWTVATGYYTHTEGELTVANGYASHAEGDTTLTSGYASHAEGWGTIAVGNYSHAAGTYNSLEFNLDTIPMWDATTQYQVGDRVRNNLENSTYFVAKVANQNTPCYRSDTWEEHWDSKYTQVVGNGTDEDNRSNAYALEWTGTAHYAGDVYVGCNNDSTGGTRLATVTEVAAKLDAAEAGLKVVRLI